MAYTHFSTNINFVKKIKNNIFVISHIIKFGDHQFTGYSFATNKNIPMQYGISKIPKKSHQTSPCLSTDTQCDVKF